MARRPTTEDLLKRANARHDELVIEALEKSIAEIEAQRRLMRILRDELDPTAAIEKALKRAPGRNDLGARPVPTEVVDALVDPERLKLTKARDEKPTLPANLNDSRDLTDRIAATRRELRERGEA